MNRFYTTLLIVLIAFGAQAQQVDNFELYPVGAYLAQTSPVWTTWSGTTGGTEDVQITNVDAYSGTNSVYFSSTVATGGPTDIVLPLGAEFNTGSFELETWMKVETNKGAYFNLQANATVGQVWALDLYFVQNGDLFLISDGSRQLQTTYPTNTWFKITMEINLNINHWELFIDGVSQGSFSNPINRIASWNIYPVNPTSVGGNNSSGFFIDDVSGTHTPYTLTARNGAVINVENTFKIAGQTKAPEVVVRNLGTQAITSFDISVDYNGNVITESVTGVNIASLATYTHTFSQDITAAGGTNTLTATISNVNGQGADLDPADDSKTITTITKVPAPGRIIVAEEGTGTWCGWCPRGTVAMWEMTRDYPQWFQGIAVHNGDPMAFTAYDQAIGTLISGYPSALVNRKPEIDPSAIEEDFLALIETPVAAVLSNEVGFNGNTREVSVDLTVEFKQAIASSGNWKVAMVLTEDSVTGGAGYAQVNSYSFQSQNIPLVGAGFDWQAEANPLPASKAVYDHVARAITPSFAGKANSFPATVSAGDTFHHRFTATLDTAWNQDRMHVVTLLIRQDGKIENAGVANVSTATPVGIEDKTVAKPYLNIYPNPANDKATVEVDLSGSSMVSLELIDITGKKIYATPETMKTGKTVFVLDLASLSRGIYFVQVKTGEKVTVKKLSVQ